MPAWSSVCVLWKQSALWVFYPTHQAKPGAPQKRGDWAKFTHAQILYYTHTRIHMECEHARSSAMPEFYAYVRTHTEYTVMLRAVKILISAWTAARLSRQCLSPLLTPLSVLCPLRLLLLLCSVVISPPSSPPFLSSPTLSPPILLLHLSPQSAPEWPCYVGGCEADSQHTHRPQYHPLICLARPNSPHSVPADSVR